MPIKIYHKDHGFVFTSDKAEIDMLMAKGGLVVRKNAEAKDIKAQRPQVFVRPPYVKPQNPNNRR